jgi:hypothetical protein
MRRMRERCTESASCACREWGRKREVVLCGLWISRVGRRGWLYKVACCIARCTCRARSGCAARRGDARMGRVLETDGDGDSQRGRVVWIEGWRVHEGMYVGGHVRRRNGKGGKLREAWIVDHSRGRAGMTRRCGCGSGAGESFRKSFHGMLSQQPRAGHVSGCIENSSLARTVYTSMSLEVRAEASPSVSSLSLVSPSSTTIPDAFHRPQHHPHGLLAILPIILATRGGGMQRPGQPSRAPRTPSSCLDANQGRPLTSASVD